MKFFFTILCLLVLTLKNEGKTLTRKRGPPPVDPPKRTATKEPKWHEITQRVDHFNPNDLRTWQMRYISNDQFFKVDGPIFIYLGGEWPIGIGDLMTGQIFDMAKEHKGYMFYTEHRYYGKSYPTEDMSTENLKYLSVDQALADVVYFIDYVKRNVKGLENSKVVVVGCSYAANMATWIRLKYPHFVDIAYASSGPLRAVADFYEYYEVVGKNIGLVSQKCLETITNATAELRAKLETEDGIEEMSERFQTCSTIRNEEPYNYRFYSAVTSDVLCNTVQYAEPTSIKNLCDKLLAYNGTSLDKWIAYVRKIYDKYDDPCIDDYDDAIAPYVEVNNTDDATRPWVYQTCTEFGYYQTTSSEKQPFGDTCPLKFYLRICNDLFGEGFGLDILNTGINRTNIFYGSVTPEVTKIVTVHGTVDPWHPLGVLNDLNPLAPAILINGTSHCADQRSIKFTDSDELKAAKRRVKELIAQWLQ